MRHRRRVMWLFLLPLAAQADSVPGTAGTGVRAGFAATEQAFWPLGPQLLSSSLGVMPAHTTLGLQPLTVARGHGVRLLGNYYLDAAAPGATTPTGFRASSGVLLAGPHGGLHARAGDRVFSGAADSGGARWTTASSYLGLGYTGAWQHGGLRVSADLGLSAPMIGASLDAPYSPGNAANLGDEAWRLRSGPLLQLGVGYSF